MSLYLTNALVERLRDELREHPLQPGEVRRIVGLGGHYLAALDTSLTEHSLSWLLTLYIDDVPYALLVGAR